VTFSRANSIWRGFEGTMILVLERAKGVRDVLDRVGGRVGEIVHRINAPRIAGAMVVRMPYPIEHRVAHIDVGRRHVDLRAQNLGAVRKLAAPHPPEEIEILGDGADAIRAVGPRLRQRAPVPPDIVAVLAVDVREPLFDQHHGIVEELLEIVGGEVKSGPLEPEPADVLFDRLDVFHVFLGGVRVVEAQVARAAEVARDAEIQTDRLRVPDVQVAVRLRRKSRGDTTIVLSGLEVFRDEGSDEVEQTFIIERAVSHAMLAA
jgi:hypothetical protein